VVGGDRVTARQFWSVLVWLGLAVQVAARSASGPWDMRSLSDVPHADWGVRTGSVQEVHYAGEPYESRPTRVFAYLGRPQAASAPGAKRFPAMVLVHGGGGKAFKAWAEHWAQRGYVALAMDLAGNGPSGRLPDGGPDQSDAVKFREFGVGEERDMWSYHAVAAVIRGHSLLRSLPEVDPGRVGLTGISWGGYLTCVVAGVDPRFQVAVPVYGCGFLGDNSVWKDKSLASMSDDARGRWLSLFDPGQYLDRVRCPILFLNGTTDFAYPLDSYRKSYQQVPSRFRYVSVVVDLPHGHIWSFAEVDTFVDAELREGVGVPRLGRAELRNNHLSARGS
jgi:cephalosporin-C deacetylase-like acetyl esterase